MRMRGGGGVELQLGYTASEANFERRHSVATVQHSSCDYENAKRCIRCAHSIIRAFDCSLSSPPLPSFISVSVPLLILHLLSSFHRTHHLSRVMLKKNSYPHGPNNRRGNHIDRVFRQIRRRRRQRLERQSLERRKSERTSMDAMISCTVDITTLFDKRSRCVMS